MELTCLHMVRRKLWERKPPFNSVLSELLMARNEEKQTGLLLYMYIAKVDYPLILFCRLSALRL